MEVGLPPASPCEHEEFEADDEATVFLIAGYAKYSRPYVWVRNGLRTKQRQAPRRPKVRTNHERLVKLSAAERDKDAPLRLESTQAWLEQGSCGWPPRFEGSSPQKDIKLWDIIAELVALCAQSKAANPFAVNFDYFAR
jgi:hypothetical protein